MARALSYNLRKRVLEAGVGGASARSIAARFGVGMDFDGDPLAASGTRSGEQTPRLRGRALCGERCRAGVPHGHWKTTIFTGGLRLAGMTALFVHDGPMNCTVFQV